MELGNFVKKHIKGDKLLWSVIFLLNIFGFIIQFSAKAKLSMEGPIQPITILIKPFFILIASFWMMIKIAKSDYIIISKYVHYLLYFSWILILFAYFYGKTQGGANRWIFIGPISFMPSDMAKLGLIVGLSKRFASRQNDRDIVYNLPVIVWTFIEVGVTCFLIMLTNFSTSVILFLTSHILMVFGRMPTKYILRIIGFVSLMAFTILYFKIGQRAETAIKRLEVYYKRMVAKNENIKASDSKNENYQLTLGYYAISTGALNPRGPGNSHYRYLLSQAESDFVYPIIIEEYGILFGILLPFSFLLLFGRTYLIIKKSTKPLGGLLAGGLMFSITSQAFINMLVAVGVLPTTGQPIPMISAGGTSLIFTSISLGLVLSISRDVR